MSTCEHVQHYQYDVCVSEISMRHTTGLKQAVILFASSQDSNQLWLGTYEQVCHSVDQ